MRKNVGADGKFTEDKKIKYIHTQIVNTLTRIQQYYLDNISNSRGSFLSMRSPVSSLLTAWHTSKEIDAMTTISGNKNGSTYLLKIRDL